MDIKKLNEALNKYIESKFNFTTFVSPDSQESKYKVGDTVNINGVNGQIIKVDKMRLSDTCTYKIKLEDGSLIYRYEEEI